MSIHLDSLNSSARICPSPYGAFVNGGREYVITNPRTPTPWTNVIANEKYGIVLSQSGGGFSWYGNCQLFRLNRWDQDLVQDRHGRWIYLQDLDAPNTIWSTTTQPTLDDGSKDEITHGMGYTTFLRELHGIESRQTVFVPLQDSCEVWILKLENQTTRPRRLRFATFIDWFLGGSGDSHREFHRLFMETQTVGNAQIAWKHPGLEENKRAAAEPGPTAVHAVNGVEVKHWMSSKAKFLGNPGRLESPEALRTSEFPVGNGRWEDPVGAAIGEIELEPGQTVAFTFVLGASAEASSAMKLGSKYTLAVAEAELAKVKEYWEKLCSETYVSTGHDGLDVMENFWLRYQLLAARMVGRCAYYQQGGAYGYRDQLQDSLALLTVAPEMTKRQLILHAEAMYEDGGVRHWWHPGTHIFAESRHSDTCLWLAYGTLAYLDETNDLKALNEECSFLNRETQQAGERATLLAHCLRGIDRTLSLRSKRGIPLIIAGDWNDGLSHVGLEGKGESVWVGMFLYDILTRLTPILAELGHPRAEELEKAAANLKSAVNEFGWDGEWYLEGTRDDGRPLGSKENKEGQIFLNPQTWAQITKIAPDDRIQVAMKAVKQRLIKPYGALLLNPAYSTVDPWVGYITRYAPGLRENGGVYSHASTWAIQALAMAGEQEAAADLMFAMLPSVKEDPTHYAAEPYSMPGNVDGPDSPNEGRAGWTWYTGSAAWLYRATLDWVLGVRAPRAGLLVEPTRFNPEKGYRVVRKFRGDTFDIRVTGTGPTSTITCDTASVSADNILTSTGKGARHIVSVVRQPGGMI